MVLCDRGEPKSKAAALIVDDPLPLGGAAQTKKLLANDLQLH